MLCAGTTRTGQPCCKLEIEGLEYCLHHVPDELLAEAEDVTGFRRCWIRFGQPDACLYYAVTGTDPPRCKVHGANRGSVLYKRATMRLAERRYALLYAEFLAERYG